MKFDKNREIFSKKCPKTPKYANKMKNGEICPKCSNKLSETNVRQV
jgi:hypothetical protein